MSVNLTGRTALVTGASSGFGRTIALGLLEAGARVALTDISEANLKGVSGEIRQYGRQAIILVSDLGNPSDVRRLVASTVDSLRHIHILVNNAGMTSGAIARDLFLNPIDRKTVEQGKCMTVQLQIGRHSPHNITNSTTNTND